MLLMIDNYDSFTYNLVQYLGELGAEVPTEFVRYPGGSHLFILNGRPSHRVDFTTRVVDWVTRYTAD